MKIAAYKCLSCSFEYKGRPGPTQCPVCNGLQIKWLNYEQLFGKLGT